MKKLPPGSEASNVLVGEVDFLSHTIIAFVRLADAVLLGDLTEVPIPTRFLFILLGPKGCQNRYHEIGRAIATLMADEVSMHNVTHFHHHNLLLFLCLLCFLFLPHVHVSHAVTIFKCTLYLFRCFTRWRTRLVTEKIYWLGSTSSWTRSVCVQSVPIIVQHSLQVEDVCCHRTQ